MTKKSKPKRKIAVARKTKVKIGDKVFTTKTTGRVRVKRKVLPRNRSLCRKDPENKDFSVEVREIHPEEASTMLEVSDGVNVRNLGDSHVRSFQRTIEEDRFYVTNDAITIDDRGYVINGQHRLMACVLANKPIKVVIIEGVNDPTGIDCGRPRSAAQVLGQTGIKNAAVVAGAARLAILYDWYGIEGVYSQMEDRPQTYDIVDYVREYPDIAEMCRPLVTSALRAGASLPQLLFCLFTGKHNCNWTEKDLDGIILHLSGKGAEETNPLWRYRERFIAEKLRAGGLRTEAPRRLRLLIHAINLHLDGKQSSRLTLKSGDPDFRIKE